MNGGLFGGKNDSTRAQWGLIARFPKADIIGFTSYPGLIYRNPSEIPDNYYSEIFTHIDKPVAITEVGWHSEASPAGWESNESEQVEFVTRFSKLVRGSPVRITIWSFLYDQPVAEPFRSMGMFRSDGTAKPAYDAWRVMSDNN